VYSNETLTLSPEGERPVAKTQLMHGSLTATMGGEFHTALNTGVFIRFWNKVLSNEKAWECDWIVKLDPDTVFIPGRLRALLRTRHGALAAPEPEHGIFLNNCHVGMHGPIEVLSKRALKSYRKGQRECETGKAAKHGQEDWYLRACFEDLGILQVDAYNLLFEATLACQERPSSWQPYGPPCFAPQVSFHPFKTIEGYMRCHLEAANHPFALPLAPIDEEPSAANERHG